MTRRNSRRSAQEAIFAPSPTTTPPDEEKAVERTETPKADVSPVECDDKDTIYAIEGYISRVLDIEPNCTNIPRLLYALLCETVRGRV